MARYTKRKDGRYATTVSTGQYKANGYPINKTIYARTIKELDEKVARIKANSAMGINVFADDINFKVYADQWFKAKEPSRSIKTNEMYTNILKNHTGLLADLPLKKITATNIQQQINTVSDKPRTAEQTLLTISQVFDSAIRDRLITFSPCDGISLPRKVKHEKRAFTEAEKRAIKAAEYSDIERAFIMIMYGCGLRPGEVYALTWSDIDLKAREITVNKSIGFKNGMPLVQYPKTNAGIRTVQMPTIVYEALVAYRQSMCCPLLFPNVNGGYRTQKRYTELFSKCKAKIIEKLGHGSEFTAYYFRHNYATELYYSGISLKEAMRLMGHSDSKMIMKIYAHLDEKRENTRTKLNAINF